MAAPPKITAAEWKQLFAFWRAVSRISTSDISGEDFRIQLRELADDYGGYDSKVMAPFYAAFDR